MDILYENHACSCAGLECKSLNIYRSQQCIEHVMYRSMEHVFLAAGLENSYILRHNDTNVNERTRIMARYAYVTINETICKIIVSSLT